MADTPKMNLSELRAIAQAANALSDKWGDADEIMAQSIDGFRMDPVDARHIAAFSPATVLRLLDRIQSLEAAATRAAAVLDMWVHSDGGKRWIWPGSAHPSAITESRETVAALRDAIADVTDLSEQGRNRSAVLGNTMQTLTEGGVPFLQALDAPLKVFDPRGDASPSAADRFCDTHCTWSNHHPGCIYGDDAALRDALKGVE